MLNDATGFKKVYIAAGYTDLRRGMEGLANIIRFQFHLDPYDKDTLFLFCGKRNDRIKGLLWEGLSAAFCYPHISSFYTKICSFLWKKYADKNYLRPQMRASSSSSSGHS